MPLRRMFDGSRISLPLSFLPCQAEFNHHLWFLLAARDTLLAVAIRPRAQRPSGARTVRPSSGNKLSKSYCIAAALPRTPAGCFRAAGTSRSSTVYTWTLMSSPLGGKSAARPPSGVDAVALSRGCPRTCDIGKQSKNIAK
jgi:hypothetical protein